MDCALRFVFLFQAFSTPCEARYLTKIPVVFRPAIKPSYFTPKKIRSLKMFNLLELVNRKCYIKSFHFSIPCSSIAKRTNPFQFASLSFHSPTSFHPFSPSPSELHVSSTSYVCGVFVSINKLKALRTSHRLQNGLCPAAGEEDTPHPW